jgi:threonine dehydratase
VTIEAVQQAASRIRSHVLRTPLIDLRAPALWLKAECLQAAGSFKLRGAFNAVLALTSEQRRRGVVTHSSGNHALAVAHVAHRLGLRATVVMPDDSPEVKLERVRSTDAEVIIVDGDSLTREETAAAIAGERGLTLIEPFDHDQIIAGAGTIGLEILADLPDVDAVFVPVSGGGLIAGVATAVKELRPSAAVIGVEPDTADDAARSLAAGRIVTITAEEAGRTAADGLRVRSLGSLTWPHVRRYVDGIVTVSEEAIRDAMRRIAFQGGLVAEPSGAVALAGALEHHRPGRRTVAIVSGGNVDPALFHQAIGYGVA